jgi:hypothetical protein
MYFGQLPPQAVTFPGAFFGATTLYNARPKSAWKRNKSLTKYFSCPQLAEEARLKPLTTAEVIMRGKEERERNRLVAGRAVYIGWRQLYGPEDVNAEYS